MRPPRVPATDEPPPTPRPARRVPAARTGPLAGHGGPGLPTPFAHRAYRVQPLGAPPTYPPRVLGPWTPVTTSSSVANGPVVATNEAPGPTETGSPVEMDGTRERMPQVLGNLIYSTDRIWLWACSGRACAGVWWPVTRWRAVSRSCTFFLQTAISKRRDHTDLSGKPGHGDRMNVQRRPSCTFILSPDAPRARKRWNHATDPTRAPDECATRPHATSRHHDLPPDGDHPDPHTTRTPPEPGSKHLRPAPYRTTRPAGTPMRPTPTAHLRPHPHNQTPYPDHTTGGHLVRPGRRRPSRQGGPVGRLGEHFAHKVTDCAENDPDSLPSAQNVTLCTKCPAPHKTSPHTTLTRTGDHHERGGGRQLSGPRWGRPRTGCRSPPGAASGRRHAPP